MYREFRGFILQTTLLPALDNDQVVCPVRPGKGQQTTYSDDSFDYDNYDGDLSVTDNESLDPDWKATPLYKRIKSFQVSSHTKICLLLCH